MLWSNLGAGDRDHWVSDLAEDSEINMISNDDLLRISRRAVSRLELSRLSPALPKSLILSPALVSAVAKAGGAYINHGMAGVSVAFAKAVLMATARTVPRLLARHRRLRGTAPIRTAYRGRSAARSWLPGRKS